MVILVLPFWQNFSKFFYKVNVLFLCSPVDNAIQNSSAKLIFHSCVPLLIIHVWPGLIFCFIHYYRLSSFFFRMSESTLEVSHPDQPSSDLFDEPWTTIANWVLFLIRSFWPCRSAFPHIELVWRLNLQEEAFWQ